MLSERKGIEGCWQGDGFEISDKLGLLKPGHGDAHIITNLRIIKKKASDEFLKGKRHWYSKVKE